LIYFDIYLIKLKKMAFDENYMQGNLGRMKYVERVGPSITAPISASSTSEQLRNAFQAETKTCPS
jgi:hypothetical protein